MEKQTDKTTIHPQFEKGKSHAATLWQQNIYLSLLIEK